MQVINAYIYLIRAEKHLLCREKSKIHLENTLIFAIQHRDGKNKDKFIPNVKEDPIVETVKKYVAHDMVKEIGCSSLRGGGGELGTIKTLTYGSN